MSDTHSLINGLHTEIDKLIGELEEVCFNVDAGTVTTQMARIRRMQLIDVREYLLRKRASL